MAGMFDELSWGELAPALAASFSAGYHGQNGTAQGIAVAQQILEQKRKDREAQAARGMLSGMFPEMEVPEGLDPQTALGLLTFQRGEQRYKEGRERDAAWREEDRMRALEDDIAKRVRQQEDAALKREQELGDQRRKGRTEAAIGNLFSPAWEFNDQTGQGLLSGDLAELRGPGMLQGLVDSGDVDMAYYLPALQAARNYENQVVDNERQQAAEAAEARRLLEEERRLASVNDPGAIKAREKAKLEAYRELGLPVPGTTRFGKGKGGKEYSVERSVLGSLSVEKQIELATTIKADPTGQASKMIRGKLEAELAKANRIQDPVERAIRLMDIKQLRDQIGIPVVRQAPPAPVNFVATHPRGSEGPAAAAPAAPAARVVYTEAGPMVGDPATGRLDLDANGQAIPVQVPAGPNLMDELRGANQPLPVVPKSRVVYTEVGPVLGDPRTGKPELDANGQVVRVQVAN